MAALLLALKALGALLLLVLALLGLVLLAPVTVELRYAKEQFTARLRVLFYTRQLFPPPPPRPVKRRKAKREKTAPAPEAAPEPPAPEAPPEEPGRGEAKRPEQPAPGPEPPAPKGIQVAGVPLGRLLELLPTVGAVGRRILAGVRVRRLRLYWPIQGEDAADTALQYGAFCAAWGSGMALVQNLVRVQCDQVEPVADFLSEHTGEEHFSCKITARVFIMVAAAVYGLIRLRRLADDTE